MSRAASNVIRVSQRSSADQIEHDLSKLWTETARTSPVSRALMSNLVIVRAPEGATSGDSKDDSKKDDLNKDDLNNAIGLPIEEVARRHPSRIVVLNHARPKKDSPGTIAADVSILIFGSAGSRFGVEEIVVRSTCVEASLRSIVRRLTLGDVPTSVWWTEDFSRVGPMPSVVTMTRQLLYDSRQWRDVRRGVAVAAALVSQPRVPDLADLNWRRLRPMCRALTHALGSSLAPKDIHLTGVRIGHRPGDASLAWLLAGWLIARLGWDARNAPVAVEEARHGDDVIVASCDGARAGEVIAAMNGHRVVVKYLSGGAPLSFALPRETLAESIAAELTSLTRDICLHDTLKALSRRFEM